MVVGPPNSNTNEWVTGWAGFNVSCQHLVVNCKNCIESPNIYVDAAAKLSRRTDRHTDGVTDSPKSLVGAQSRLCRYDQLWKDWDHYSLKITGAKGDLCPGSFVTTGANAPVAPVESAPMSRLTSDTRLDNWLSFCRHGRVIVSVAYQMLLICKWGLVDRSQQTSNWTHCTFIHLQLHIVRWLVYTVSPISLKFMHAW